MFAAVVEMYGAAVGDSVAVLEDEGRDIPEDEEVMPSVSAIVADEDSCGRYCGFVANILLVLGSDDATEANVEQTGKTIVDVEVVWAI